MERSIATTLGIRVEVEPSFRADLSDPARGPWVFQYAVEITNLGASAATLVARHWIITHGDGNVEHVRGAGVVGEQPRLEPGARFHYVSACPLSTTLGAMHGTYAMVRDDGTRFDAVIAPFTLVVPGTEN